VLVAAVLGPQEREDGKLEIVRVAREQRLHTVELSVGKTERAVEWLLGDRAQGAMVSAL
jgi:hypothetical protein